MALEYPRSLLVAQFEDGSYAVAETPAGLDAQFPSVPVHIARYVKAGEGSLHTKSAYYVEDAKA